MDRLVATGHGNGWRLNPGWPRLRSYLLLGLGLDLLFVVVYGGANALAARRDDPYRVHFNWELDIPLVPWMVLIYLSVLVLMLLPPFALGVVSQRRMAVRVAVAILVAGTVFLLFPATLGFPVAEPAPGFDALFRLIRTLDRPHNLLPSLHVAISAIIVATLWPQTPAAGRIALGTWLMLICTSVVLVHQHHLADVAGGLALAWLLEHTFATARRPT